MKIIAKKGADFELIPDESYAARCVQMVHLGRILNEKFNKTQDKVRLVWELPTHLVKDKDSKEMPALISQDYTLSLGSKATLGKMLVSWKGKPLTTEELAGFDICVLVGAPCLLQVVHNVDKKDASKVYANVLAVQKLPKGMECPKQVHESLIFGYEPFSQELFDRLSDYVKKMVMSSENFKELAASGKVKVSAEVAAAVSAAKADAPDDDDSPF